ncbi:hypothetical protein [Pontibacter sp. 13R65]|uniref:hypothetical protein n=1 Tax=Pontibacter sp. 13R65 TaxID=3127458 RepID=UPI00301E42D1
MLITSIAGSLLSVFTLSSGWGEVYPFFSWKLFTQPLGNKGSYTEYRIYTSNTKEGAKWQRQEIKATPTFTTDEYYYCFNALVKTALADSARGSNAKANLFSFVRHVVPAAHAYKIVEEIYAPLELLNNPTRYDTLTVITF